MSRPEFENKTLPKLIIQIPCYNEAETLAIALNDLPRTVNGFDSVEWLIVNDGSRDERSRSRGRMASTTSSSRQHRVSPTPLPPAWSVPRRGADIIVNTDADNQYDASDIPR